MLLFVFWFCFYNNKTMEYGFRWSSKSSQGVDSHVVLCASKMLSADMMLFECDEKMVYAARCCMRMYVLMHQK